MVLNMISLLSSEMRQAVLVRCQPVPRRYHARAGLERNVHARLAYVGGTHDKWIQANCRPYRVDGRLSVDLHRDARAHDIVAAARTGVSVLGYLAIDDEYRGIAGDVSDRVPVAEHPKPRHPRAAVEAR